MRIRSSFGSSSLKQQSFAHCDIAQTLTMSVSEKSGAATKHTERAATEHTEETQRLTESTPDVPIESNAAELATEIDALFDTPQHILEQEATPTPTKLKRLETIAEGVWHWVPSPYTQEVVTEALRILLQRVGSLGGAGMCALQDEANVLHSLVPDAEPEEFVFWILEGEPNFHMKHIAKAVELLLSGKESVELLGEALWKVCGVASSE